MAIRLPHFLGGLARISDDLATGRQYLVLHQRSEAALHAYLSELSIELDRIRRERLDGTTQPL